MILEEQKQKIKSLDDLLIHVQTCESLHPSDPIYYAEKIAEYWEEYSVLVESLYKSLNNSK